MSVEKLKRAQKALVLANIYIRKSRIELEDAFEPTFSGTALEVQSRTRVIGHRGSLNESGEAGAPLELLAVEVETAARFLFADSTRALPIEGVEPKRAGDKIVAGEITCVFNAVYHRITELDDEARDIFFAKNAVFHIWPYWREYLSSTCSRLLIQPIVLPMYVIPAAHEADKNSDPPQLGEMKSE